MAEKKWIYTDMALVICIILAAVLSLSSSAESNLSDEAHVYKYLPGSEEWNAARYDRLELCRVEEEELENMTTRAVVETVLNYPFLLNIFVYSTPKQGVEAVASHFPGIYELGSRSDAVKELNKYINSCEACYGSYYNSSYAGAPVISLKKDAAERLIYYYTGRLDSWPDIDW